MSKPTLYKTGPSPVLTAAHQFARQHKVSIRKARRLIARLVKDGVFIVYRKARQ